MEKHLTELSEADFKEIANFSALFFTPREIALMMELPAEAFITECETETTKCFEAFQSGRLKSEMELRSSVLKLAKSGSSPAQTMALDMLNRSKTKMMDR